MEKSDRLYENETAKDRKDQIYQDWDQLILNLEHFKFSETLEIQVEEENAVEILPNEKTPLHIKKLHCFGILGNNHSFKSITSGKSYYFLKITLRNYEMRLTLAYTESDDVIWLETGLSNENFWNQAKRHMRKFNGTPKKNFNLFLQECVFRFHHGSVANQLKILKRWSNIP